MTTTLLASTTLLLTSFLLVRRLRLARPKAPATPASPSIGTLVVGVERGLEACLHRQAEATEALQAARDQFAAYVTSIQREKAQAEKSFESLTLQLLLLVDVLDGWMASPSVPDEERTIVASLQANLLNTLRSVRILPLAIPRGAPFNPERMVPMERVHTDLPEGVVVSVSRPGFEFRPGQGRARGLRPAEVVVSAGPAPAPKPAADTAAPGGTKPLLTTETQNT